jgi:valyl-tRNA synthetase
MDMPKAYNPAEVEDAIYKKWEDSGFFGPPPSPPSPLKLRGPGRLRRAGDKKSVKHFSIVMPPPNVTGTLHVGHAVMLALQDIMTRFHRMRGDDTVWIPGTDHAAIATQTKVEKLLKEKGESRHSLGREKFLAEVYKFVQSSKETIHRQIRKMGCSCDWPREAYTLDETRSLAVRTIFKRMYDDGLIYRGERIVNWCPHCASTLADDEVEHREEEGRLYYIVYKISPRESLIVATTRPETKLGDTALAVNPKDERYKKYIGKELDVDLAGHKIHVRVIGERTVDQNFGTGVVGVTPAHSMTDWQMAEKNNLPVIKIIGQDGKMTEAAGKYVGLAVAEAREKFLADLGAAGLLQKTENIKHNVGICYRSGDAVEQLPSKQWFVSTANRFRLSASRIKGIRSGSRVSLKELAIAVVKNGQIKILPERFEKIYFHWMNDLRDWCISRQIWFGHRIPVWYKGEEIYVGVEAPAGQGWVQDFDTLDTWFSSGLWTFSTLDWPNKKNELARFHPTSVLETGYDILFFWVARMILMTTYALGEVPFETIYLHGLVRDEQGRKMSKSLGNVIDPLTVAEKYGTDAVRLSLVLGTSPGNDVKLSEEKIAGFRNFTNKLWNIGRFVLGQTTDHGLQTTAKTLADKCILSKLNNLVLEVTDDLEKMRFSEAGEKLREFTWGDFADWYVEINKTQPNNPLLLTTYYLLLKLWHPFMPYVTEELWGLSGQRNLLMIAEWPKADKKKIDKKAEKDFEILRQAIIKMRNLRAEHNVPPAEMAKFEVISKNIKLFEENIGIVKRFARAEVMCKKSASAVAQIKIVLGAASLEKEKSRLMSEKENLEKYLASLRSKLTNQDFVSRAPKVVVDGERAKLREVEEKLRKIKEQIAVL